MKIEPNALYAADCLALLERVHSGRVALVYLDPPWYIPPDTLCDVSWSPLQADNTTETTVTFRDYLAFLSKVLQQSRRVLSESGNIFFHTAPGLGSDIRLLLDQVFGRANFRSEFIFPYPGHRGLYTPTPQHSVILYYSKTDDFIYNPPVRHLSEAEIGERYGSYDEHGPYRLAELTSFIDRPSLQFEWAGFVPPPKRSWRFSKDRLDALESEGKIYYRLSTGFPRLKVYLSENPTVEVGSVWYDLKHSALTSGEKLGLAGQQPIELLKRVIKMGSNPGNVVLDPFCGSGTALIAAQELERRWIGCDVLPVAIDAVIERFESLGLRPNADFSLGDQGALKVSAPRIPFYYSPLTLPEDVTLKPLIITEGKTDWKHLKAAFLRLQGLGIFEDLDIEFHEYEDEIKMGDGELMNLCKHLSKIHHPRKIICIFDRDVASTVRQVSGRDDPHKDWGNNVFSFALPVPNHRQEDDGICIELFYTDEEIKRTDAHGRRLFLSSEFNPRSGRHRGRENLICANPGRSRGIGLVVVDGDVFDSSNQNVALPKSHFADYVLAEVENFDNFDVAAFGKVFGIVVDIAMT